MPLLEVKNLNVSFGINNAKTRIVNDVSFAVERGKTLALVGESGSGKSVSAMSILRLLDKNGSIDSGEILFQENENEAPMDLMKLSLKQMQAIRGNKISVVFQEPMTALNPVLTVERQLCEPLRIHRSLSKAKAREQAQKKLAEVQIPAPERVLKAYPHTLSGGMRQRVMIAMALACQPKLLIADEPTTALDVTVQAQILSLMKTLQEQNGAAILFITHDLGVVNEMADDVAVMYAGQIMELSKKSSVFYRGAYSHPYTEGLLRSIPTQKTAGKRLECIRGNVPSPKNLPKGCKFAPRCRYCTQKCVDEEPPLFTTKSGQKIRCFYPKKEARQSDEHAKLTLDQGA